jgi:hypothetical protein
MGYIRNLLGRKVRGEQKIGLTEHAPYLFSGDGPVVVKKT